MTEKNDQTTAPAADSDETSNESVDLEAIRRELEEATRKGQEYLALAQRAQADLQNYRRRIEAERGESIRAGKSDLALRILPVLDDFEHAMRNMSGDVAPSDWVKGFDLIARKFRSALELEGITRIEALGADFDPYQHEAVLQGPSADDQAGKVIEIFRDGYRFGDRVLRPAQVKVGTGGA